MKKKLVSFLFILCVIIGSIVPSVVLAENYKTSEFEWNFEGKTWNLEITVPNSRYNQYSSISVDERFIYGHKNFNYLVTTKDAYITYIASAIRNCTNLEGFSEIEEISFLLAFVQSLPYTSDSLTTGYDDFPRFPLETLVDGGGDCEDSSILFATLLIALGYDAIFISPPNHLAVGVAMEHDIGYCIELKAQQYFYCETTSSGWTVGNLPQSLLSSEEKFVIIPINPNLQCRLELRMFLIVTVIFLSATGGITIFVVRKKKKQGRLFDLYNLKPKNNRNYKNREIKKLDTLDSLDTLNTLDALDTLKTHETFDTFDTNYKKNMIKGSIPSLSKECAVDSCAISSPMPFVCKYCGKTFCSTHRLPENHDCIQLAVMKKKK